MTKWLLITSLILTLFIFGFFYLRVSNIATPQTATTTTSATDDEVNLLHSFKDNVHRYSGQLKLPHSCYTVTTEAQRDPSRNDHYNIMIHVVDNLAQQGFCSKIATRYPFEVLIDAFEGISLTLEVNGKEIPVHITESEWNTPNGSYITPLNKTSL